MKKMNLKMIGVLVCLALTVVTVAALGTLTVGAQQGTDDTSILFPTLPSINAAYPDTSTFGIDIDAVDAQFPRKLDISYTDGVISIKDFGADVADMLSNNEYYTLTLTDGYWTAEIPDRSDNYQDGETEFFWFNFISPDGSGTRYLLSYMNGNRDSYVTLESQDGITLSINADHDIMTVQYVRDEYCVDDEYKKGVLTSHKVTLFDDNTAGFECLNFNADGSIAYATAYTDNYYYYFPNLGWSTDWYQYVAGPCPAGYEGLDEAYFSAKIRSFFYCAHAEAPGATCTEDSVCPACGDVIEQAAGHVWGEHGTEQTGICTVCAAPRVPAFAFISGTYETLAESGFPYEEIRSLFSSEVEVLYENGKYMVKDIGADHACIYTSADYERVDMTYENGYWVYMMDEQLYDDPSVDIFVDFRGKDQLWQILYQNGEVLSSVQLSQYSEYEGDKVILVYMKMDWVETLYSVGDYTYRDSYQGDIFVKQMVDVRVGDDRITVIYDEQKTLLTASVSHNDGNYYYYTPGQGWSLNTPAYSPETACAAPAGYENYGTDELAALVPCTIGCTHQSYTEADCVRPAKCTLCGRQKEGSTALGHDIVIDPSKTPTCTEEGLTQGEHCTRCDGNTVLQESVPVAEHDWADATTQAPKTCRMCGATEGDPLPPAETEPDVTEPDATDPDVTEPDATEPEENGCKAAIGVGAVALVATIGAAIALKKKKDR